MCLKCESTTRRFQPGERPSRGFLHDCTTPPSRLIVCSTNVLATRINVWFCSNFDETREAVNKIEIHEAANKTEATSL